MFVAPFMIDEEALVLPVAFSLTMLQVWRVRICNSQD